MNKHYPSLDLLKFLMALAVVAIHSVCVPAVLFPAARLAVPAFFILTGFFFFRKMSGAESRETQNRILKRTVVRYAKLYLFWFILLLPFTVYVRKYHQMEIGEAVLAFGRDLLFGSTFPASWYLMACLEGILIVYLLCRWLGRKTVSVICVLVYILATASSELQGIVAEDPMLHGVFEGITGIIGKPYNNFLIAVPYIYLGKMLAEGYFDAKSSGVYAAGFAACLAGLMLEWFVLQGTPYFVYNCDCYFMLAPTALFLVLAVRNLRITFVYGLQARNISTIIYCCHYCIVLVIREIRDMLQIPDAGNLLLFISGALVSFCAALVILKLETNKKLSWLKYSH